ncbi:MAG: ABC transporter permease [Acidimicrobiia bacterium]
MGLKTKMGGTSTEPDSGSSNMAPTSGIGLAKQKSRARAIAKAVLPPLVVGVIVLAGWYFVSYGLLDDRRRFLLEPPHAVLKVGFLDGEHFSEILRALWNSTQIAIFGLSIAVAIGFFLAIVMSQAKMLETAFFPYLVTMQALPVLALVPMISFWFGTGWQSRVIICVIISLFPIIVNTLFGLQSADRDMHDLFTMQQASRLTRLRKLMFPAALPAIFGGLRISAGLSVVGAVVGDFFFGRGEPGIGQRILRYSSELKGEQLIAAVIMTSALGVAVFLLFGWIQNRAVGKWYESAEI